MASYKIPQDVEAEDKLLGPFSFRQFIYLIIAILAGGLAYFLGTIFVGLAIIPAPIAIVFLIIALPLRKDQPMEIYALAILSFYFKPRLRFWEADGIMTLIEFTDNVVEDEVVLPDISFSEAKQRISFLSNIVDSNGEIIKNPNFTASSLKQDVIMEANQVEDIHDSDTDINQRFDKMLTQANEERREHIIETMQNKFSQPASSPEPIPSTIPFTTQTPTSTQPQIATESQPIEPATQPTGSSTYQPTPYTANFDYYQPQTFTNSLNDPNYTDIPLPPPPPVPFNPSVAPEPVEPTSQSSYVFTPPSQDIINLANNNDLTIQTIASEAKKITDRRKKLLGEEEEVVISLRK